MSHRQGRFLGSGALGRELSAFEHEFFQYSAADITVICQAFRPKYRIAVAIQLGFMRLTGSRLDELTSCRGEFSRSSAGSSGRRSPTLRAWARCTSAGTRDVNTQPG